MFHQREKFHVRKSEIFHITNELGLHLTISERAIVFFHLTAPASKVDFINRVRFCVAGLVAFLLLPLLVGPCMAAFPNDGCCLRCYFGVERKWISLFQKFPGVCGDTKLVRFTFMKPGKESLPYTRLIPARVKGVVSFLPMIEISKHANFFCIGSPYGKE